MKKPLGHIFNYYRYRHHFFRSTFVQRFWNAWHRWNYFYSDWDIWTVNKLRIQPVLMVKYIMLMKDCR